jgi:predicted nucleic acid-binding protein
MLLVYSLLQGHPASQAFEQFLRSHTGWFTTTLVLFEAKAVLTKVYRVDPVLASQKLAQFATGPCLIAPVDPMVAVAAMSLADTQGLDLPDAVLLQTVLSRRAAYLATEDQRLAQACQRAGVRPESPLDAALRQQVAAWEDSHLPPKGLARILRQVHHWLGRAHPQAAQDFWTQTGGCSHLP